MDDIEYRANAMIARSRICHYGVKGMKWHQHKYRQDQDQDSVSSNNKERDPHAYYGPLDKDYVDPYKTDDFRKLMSGLSDAEIRYLGEQERGGDKELYNLYTQLYNARKIQAKGKNPNIDTDALVKKIKSRIIRNTMIKMGKKR